MTYSGYQLDDAPLHPDVLLMGAGGKSLLYHSGMKITPNEQGCIWVSAKILDLLTPYPLVYKPKQNPPVLTNESFSQTNVTAVFEPYYWVQPSGAPAERKDLMVVLNSLEGVYLRASYGTDSDGQVRLSGVVMDSAEEVEGGNFATVADSDIVSSVELCECPPGMNSYDWGPESLKAVLLTQVKFTLS